MRFAATAAALLALSACDRPAASQASGSTPRFEVADVVKIHGHRGARGLRPENTLPSIEVALDEHVDFLELDLHLSRDDQIVIWHDPYVTPMNCRLDSARDDPAMAGPHGPPLPKYPLTLSAVDPDRLPFMHPASMLRNQRAAQLRRLKCDRNPDETRFPEQVADPTPLAGADYGIVTLDEVFAFVQRYAKSPQKSDAQRANAASVQFNLELKRSEHYETYIADGFEGTSPAVFERRLVEVVQSRDAVERVLVQSFDDRTLWAVRTLQPRLRLSALEREGDETPGTREHPDVAFSEWARLGASVWSPDHDLVTAENVAQAKAAGLQIVPWTINDADEMRRVVKLGVDGIITDRPDLVGHPAKK